MPWAPDREYRDGNRRGVFDGREADVLHRHRGGRQAIHPRAIRFVVSECPVRPRLVVAYAAVDEDRVLRCLEAEDDFVLGVQPRAVLVQQLGLQIGRRAPGRWRWTVVSPALKRAAIGLHLSRKIVGCAILMV